MNIEPSYEYDTISNPYKYKIYEYDTAIEGEAWENFYNEINSVNLDEISHLPAEDQLEFLYNLVDASADKFLDKKHGFINKEGKKRRFIPDNIRKTIEKENETF